MNIKTCPRLDSRSRAASRIDYDNIGVVERQADQAGVRGSNRDVISSRRCFSGARSRCSRSEPDASLVVTQFSRRHHTRHTNSTNTTAAAIRSRCLVRTMWLPNRLNSNTAVSRGLQWRLGRLGSRASDWSVRSPAPWRGTSATIRSGPTVALRYQHVWFKHIGRAISGRIVTQRRRAWQQVRGHLKPLVFEQPTTAHPTA